MNISAIRSMVAQTPLKPLIFFGPSGSGKSTLAAHVLSRYAGHFDLSISATTRNPRPSERDGISYYFMQRAEFDKKVQFGEFLEHMQYNGNCYGTPISEISRIIEAGRVPVLDIDVSGVQRMVELFGEMNSVRVFVDVTDEAVLRQRLSARKTETEESLAARLAITLQEMKFLAANKLHTAIVDNANLELAKVQLDALIEAQYTALLPVN